MNIGQTLFTQVMSFVPWSTFERIVIKYKGNHRARSLSCAEQFRILAFAQMTYRESLRDIEACLGAQPQKLYGMGLRQTVARSTLADANKSRYWRIWAEFRSIKSAIKLHTLLDLRGNIPSFIHISNGKTGDPRILDLITAEAGAIYIMDRGYFDGKRLYRLEQAKAFFVTRAKCNTKYRRISSQEKDKNSGVMSDQTIALSGSTTKKDYPQHLRRIGFYDAATDKRLFFLTNNFMLPAVTIADIYKNRWQVELFFKWIKGISKNLFCGNYRRCSSPLGGRLGEGVILNIAACLLFSPLTPASPQGGRSHAAIHTQGF